MHDQGIGLHVPKTEQDINNTRTCAQRNVTETCDLPVLIHLMLHTLAVKKKEELQVTVAVYDVSIACVSET